MKLLGNFLSLAGAETVSKILTFAAFAYLARTLGAENFGLVEWAGAVMLCAGLIVDQGFGFYGAREISKKPERAAELIAEIVGARILLAFAAFGVIVALAFGLPHAENIKSLLLLYGLSLFAAPLMLSWVYQSFDKMRTVAMIQLVRQSVFVFVVLAFVRNGAQIWIVALAEVFAAVIAAAGSVSMLQERLSLPFKISFRLSGKLFREGVPIGLSQMFWTVKMFGATFIFGIVATAEETGYFAAAMRIFIALHTFVWLYYFNLLPTMARAWAKGGKEFSGLIKNSMRIIVPLSLAGGAIWILTAPFVMTTAYGQEFSGGGSALQWLAGACVAAAISGHYRFGLIAAGFQKKEMLISALSAGSAALLIPIGYFRAGTSGAAAALCFTETVVLICARLVAGRMLFAAKDLPRNCFENLSEAAR